MTKKNHKPVDQGANADDQAHPVDPAQPDTRDAEIEGLKKELLYQMAEVDNFKRRTEKRYADALKYACEPLMKELLGVADNLERAAAHAGETSPAIAEGISNILTQLDSALTRHGAQEIQAQGEKFDPNFHEALAQVPGPEDGMVVAVHEKGYTIHGKLLRPSKVIVSKLA